MQQLTQQVQKLIDPVITSMGYELVGVEYLSGGDGLLRVYIDKDDGIDVDDCQRVSHQVSGVLDVEDPIPGQYQLEVSSPGLDRPLFTAEQFRRFVGHDVSVQLGAPLDGRRKFKGRLLGADDTDVAVEVDGSEYSLPLAQIDRARLVPDYDRGRKS